MYQTELETAKQIARQAGEIMRRYFYSGQERQLKSDGTPLTFADTAINRLVIEQLKLSFPADIVIGEEESTGGYGLGRRWFCDPIDGTKAYTWGVPTAMFSLALVVDGQPTVGVCYEPMLDKMYWATTEEPAVCNDQPIQVNNQTLDDGILATISSQQRLRRAAPYMDALLDRRPVISMAAFSGAVAKSIRVAEGRFVGYLEELVGPHDMAAVDIIIRQAGGLVTDFSGSKLDYSRLFQGAVVSNKIIHQELTQLVNSSSRGPVQTGIV